MALWDESLAKMRGARTRAVQRDPANGMPLHKFEFEPNWDVATVDLEVSGIQYNPSWAFVAGTDSISQALAQLMQDYFLTNPRYGLLSGDDGRLNSRCYHSHSSAPTTNKLIAQLFG